MNPPGKLLHFKSQPLRIDISSIGQNNLNTYTMSTPKKVISSPFDRSCLAGKVALVTGGGSGICFSVARWLGRHGVKLAIMGRTASKLESAVLKMKSEGIQCIPVAGDVRKFEDCQKSVQDTISAYGRLDILINGAAGNFLCPPEALSPNAFKTVIDIDLIGTFNMSRASFEHLKKSGDAVIINITATLQLRGTPFQAHAMAAKAGVDALTKGLAADWGEFGIRCVGIAPGYTKGTEGLKRLVPGQVDAIVKTIVPVQRMGTKKEIGLTAVYVCSEAGKYVTGSTILCEGGEALFYPRPVKREVLINALASKKSKL